MLQNKGISTNLFVPIYPFKFFFIVGNDRFIMRLFAL